MKILRLLLALFFTLAIAYADDAPLADFSEESIPIRNEELRKIKETAKDNAADVATNTVAIAAKGLGDWDNGAPWVKDTAYLAATDGFVIVIARGVLTLYIRSDGANPPTTVRAQFYQAEPSAEMSLMAPVRKGDYWKVTGAGAGSVTTIYWIPLE